MPMAGRANTTGDASLRARATIRCVVDDLRLRLPPVEVDIGTLAHPLIAETHRLAPSAPTGQKRVLAISHPMIYRVRHGRWRGATWVDETHERVWLCAGAQREEGSHDDAFAHFVALHDSERLLPNSDDELRDRAEESARTITDARSVLPEALTTAMDRRDADTAFVLAPGIGGRLHVPGPGDEIWIALGTRMADGRFVPDGLRDVLFVIALELAQAVDAEPRPDWPTGQLAWHEIARLGLRDAQGSD
jgi:hypothetical protein